jgi:hypothetical protein
VSLPFKTESNGLYVVKHDSGSRMCVLAENMERTESAAPLLCCPKYQNLVCNGACKEAGESRG